MKIGCGAFFVLSALIVPQTSLTPAIDAKTIIERSIAPAQLDWEAAPGYSYFERTRKDSGPVYTYHVFMIEGSPYQELEAINGVALSPEQHAAQQRELDRVINERQNESPRERERRVAEYEKERQRDRLMMEQITQAFDFTLQGTQRLDGFDVYVLQATPRPGYRPPNIETEALRGMQGKLWIDQKTFQWVKAEAEVVHPVSIEGFLARIEPGTRFELEKMPVGGGVWLPKHFSEKSRARIFFFFAHRQREDDVYYDYQLNLSPGR